MCYFIGQISQGKRLNANSMVRQHNCISEALKIKLTLLNIFSRHILRNNEIYDVTESPAMVVRTGLYSRFCFVSYFSVACLFPWLQFLPLVGFCAI